VRYADHIFHIGNSVFFGSKEEYLKSEAGKLFLLQQQGGETK
jgi:zinc transport system ATP-binding protein